MRSNWLLALLNFSLLMFISSCSTSNTPASSSCSTQGCSIPEPLAVVSTSPTDGATNVPLSECPYANGPCRGIVAMTFNQSVNIDSMNFQIQPFIRGTLRCPDPQNPGIAIYGCRAPNPPTTIPPNQSVIVWFDGESTFSPNTLYTATILSVSSSDGKPLGKAYSFSFTTAAQ